MLEMVDRLLPAANVSTLLEILLSKCADIVCLIEYAEFQPFLRFWVQPRRICEAACVDPVVSTLLEILVNELAVREDFGYVKRFQPFLRFY